MNGRSAVSALGEKRAAVNRLKAGAYIMSAMSNASRDKLFLAELAEFTRHDPAMIEAFLTPLRQPGNIPSYVAAVLSDDPDLHKTERERKKRSFSKRGRNVAFLRPCSPPCRSILTGKPRAGAGGPPLPRTAGVWRRLAP